MARTHQSIGERGTPSLEAQAGLFLRSVHDQAFESCAQKGRTPVLGYAGDQPHPAVVATQHSPSLSPGPALCPHPLATGCTREPLGKVRFRLGCRCCRCGDLPLRAGLLRPQRGARASPAARLSAPALSATSHGCSENWALASPHPSPDPLCSSHGFLKTLADTSQSCSFFLPSKEVILCEC